MQIFTTIFLFVAFGSIYCDLTAAGQAPNLKRFVAKYDFEDFPAHETFQGKPAPVNYKSHRLAREFKSVITRAAQQGANFAGHYTFVSWGCGSPCMRSAIVDSKTGRVYQGPDATLGFEVQLNSRLVKVNPPDRDGYYEDTWYSIPELYVWSEKEKRFALLQSDWKDKKQAIKGDKSNH